MAARLVQDIKTHRTFRPPAPAWLRYIYVGSVLIVLYSAGMVGKTAMDAKSVEKDILRDRTELAQAQSDVARFTEMQKAIESSQKIDRSRREFRAGSFKAAELQLAVLRSVQEVGQSQKKDRDTALQLRSMQLTWVPASREAAAGAKLELRLDTPSAKEERALIQREFNTEIRRRLASLSLGTANLHWGDAAGGMLSFSVDLTPTIQEGKL